MYALLLDNDLMKTLQPSIKFAGYIAVERNHTLYGLTSEQINWEIPYSNFEITLAKKHKDVKEIIGNSKVLSISDGDRDTMNEDFYAGDYWIFGFFVPNNSKWNREMTELEVEKLFIQCELMK